MHFIDEGTLYHTGLLSGRSTRSTDEQIDTFEQAWLQWAGPCKTLYLDPAGEYVSPMESIPSRGRHKGDPDTGKIATGKLGELKFMVK